MPGGWAGVSAGGQVCGRMDGRPQQCLGTCDMNPETETAEGSASRGLRSRYGNVRRFAPMHAGRGSGRAGGQADGRAGGHGRADVGWAGVRTDGWAGRAAPTRAKRANLTRCLPSGRGGHASRTTTPWTLQERSQIGLWSQAGSWISLIMQHSACFWPHVTCTAYPLQAFWARPTRVVSWTMRMPHVSVAV